MAFWASSEPAAALVVPRQETKAAWLGPPLVELTASASPHVSGLPKSTTLLV